MQRLTLSIFITENSGHVGSRELAWLCKPCSSLAGGNHRRARLSPPRSLSLSLPKGRCWAMQNPAADSGQVPPSPHAAQSRWQRGARGCPIPTATSCRLEPTSIFQAAAARPQSHLPPASSSWLMTPKAPSRARSPFGDGSCSPERCLPITNHLRATCRETLQLSSSPTPHLLSSTNI